jgi:hypothetical protein
MTELTEEQQKMEAFLADTKERFDKYFESIGYVCFVFKKGSHSGQSVFITNTDDKEVIAVLQPYANAPVVAEKKAKKLFLKNMRRVK